LLVPQGGKSGFVFCCPDFDPARPARTSVSAHDLYDALAAVAGRKLVILDACRSGHLAGQPVRDLTPGGRGPIILAACDSGESSWEDPTGLRHGLFVYAILEAARERFERADENRDGRLDAREIFDYASDRLPELLKPFGPKVTQTPVSFPAEPERYDLLTRRPPARK